MKLDRRGLVKFWSASMQKCLFFLHLFFSACIKKKRDEKLQTILRRKRRREIIITVFAKIVALKLYTYLTKKNSSFLTLKLSYRIYIFVYTYMCVHDWYSVWTKNTRFEKTLCKSVHPKRLSGSRVKSSRKPFYSHSIHRGHNHRFYLKTRPKQRFLGHYCLLMFESAFSFTTTAHNPQDATDIFFVLLLRINVPHVGCRDMIKVSPSCLTKRPTGNNSRKSWVYTTLHEETPLKFDPAFQFFFHRKLISFLFFYFFA